MSSMEDGLSRMIIELQGNTSHIGWFKMRMRIDERALLRMRPTLQKYVSHNMKTLQLEYCNIPTEQFRELLAHLNGAASLKRCYFTHFDFDAATFASFIERNNIHLDVLDIDTCTTDMNGILNMCGTRIASLSCGRTFGLRQSVLEKLLERSLLHPFYIRTGRLLANEYRYNGAFRPRSETEALERCIERDLVERIQRRNAHCKPHDIFLHGRTEKC